MGSRKKKEKVNRRSIANTKLMSLDIKLERTNCQFASPHNCGHDLWRLTPKLDGFRCEACGYKIKFSQRELATWLPSLVKTQDIFLFKKEIAHKDNKGKICNSNKRKVVEVGNKIVLKCLTCDKQVKLTPVEFVTRVERIFSGNHSFKMKYKHDCPSKWYQSFDHYDYCRCTKCGYNWGEDGDLVRNIFERQTMLLVKKGRESARRSRQKRQHELQKSGSRKKLKVMVNSEGFEKKSWQLDGSLKDLKALQSLRDDIHSSENASKPITKTFTANDFLTRSNLHSCRFKNHILTEIVGKVKKIRRFKEVVEVSFPAVYCKNCNRCYITEIEYKKLTSVGVLLCRVIEEQYLLSKGMQSPYSSWNTESKLHSFGYNVSQATGLSREQRETLLKILVDYKIMTRQEILEHLSWLISQKQGQKRMEIACRKWQEDYDFVSDLKYVNHQVDVKRIYHKHYKRQ